MEEKKTVLEVQKIDTYYGLSHILFGVSLEIREGEVMCLLGRNGAGKTTTIRSIAGLTPPKSGNVLFMGEDITKKPVHAIARKGVLCAFSDRRVFGELTVKENLEIGRRSPSADDGMELWDFERVYELFPVLKKYQKRWAGTLSGGEQQILCVARALMGNPKLLLLDEPTTGLAPVIVDTMGEHILKLKDQGLSVLLAEQNVKFAMELGDRCCVIDVGEIRFQGSFDELSKSEYVMRTYLAV
ncbi:MAG: ABC transporter ATP-binding protein [Candidatus Tectomicrobia bacterium]|uniref:ABC transporter ATP-binding protein n=1 Tax=Tectimicrobiota bacterium TaxID=2528274 RepID=A0A933GMJ8_UNCTE|nr:ABC transporter ATP-binding protein [Candidatus Tectomicrobia bacterium]